jgi:hypothetical protein
MRALVPGGRAGDMAVISSSEISSGLIWTGGASSAKVTGSTNLTNTLFFALSTSPSLFFLGVNP